MSQTTSLIPNSSPNVLAENNSLTPVSYSYCNPNNFVCGQPPSVPSGRARQRRNQIALARNCPPPQEACSLIGSFGYECVDTQVSLTICLLSLGKRTNLMLTIRSFCSCSQTSNDAEAVMVRIVLSCLGSIESTARRVRASFCESFVSRFAHSSEKRSLMRISLIVRSCTDGHRYDKINDSCILLQQE